jgi:hypothetical protein
MAARKEAGRVAKEGKGVRGREWSEGHRGVCVDRPTDFHGAITEAPPAHAHTRRAMRRKRTLALKIIKQTRLTQRRPARILPRPLA